jgi:hypothetical protein
MSNKKVNKRTLVIAGTAAIMLLAATVIATATTEIAFAYNKNQATSQANDCGNGEVPIDVFCQNLASQIQGDHNTVAMAAEQGFAEEPSPPPPPPPGACQACFDPLTDAQLEELAVQLTEQFGVVFPDNPSRQQIIDTICAALERGSPPPGLVPGQVNGAMAQIESISNEVRQTVFACLNDLF